MLYHICFFASLAIFGLSITLMFLLSLRTGRFKRGVKPFYIFAGGVFISATALFYALNRDMFAETFAPGISTLLASVHNAIRLFIVDFDFSFMVETTQELPFWLKSGYVMLGGVLLVLSPVLTVGVILSFFEKLSAYRRYMLGYFKDVYIFSELNDRSLALAKSLKIADKKRMIIFTDVFDDESEEAFDLSGQAKELNAIIFKQDVSVVNFRFHSRKSKMYFFIMGRNENENIDQTVKLCRSAKSEHKKMAARGELIAPKTPYEELEHIHDKREKYGYDRPSEDTRLYFFSENAGSEQYLSAVKPKYIKVRRVNPVRSVIYNLLYSEGMQIFDSAEGEKHETGKLVYNPATKKNDREKKISALVVGMGAQGTELIKALTWFSQMHPYKLEINAFDRNPNADGILKSGYPELFDINPVCEKPKKGKKYNNGDFETPGEAHYIINVYGGYDVDTYKFDEKISKLTDTTYVFISLGGDDINIRTSTKIRILLRRLGCTPLIRTIVFDKNNQTMLREGKTVSGESYEIQPFGDIRTMYSEECVLNSALEEKALDRHLEYVKKLIAQKGVEGEEKEKMLAAEEETFWRYDYNYRSSVASVIHTDYKKRLGIPGSNKKPAERDEEELWFYRRLEHARWNAYVRSEGYVFAKKRDKLAKTHHLLVPFDELVYEEQIKDDD